MNDNNVIIT